MSVRFLIAGLSLVALAACSVETPDSPPPAAAVDAPVLAAGAAAPVAAPELSTEDACRLAVQVQYGLSGDAVDYADGAVSWRAPVDGGRLSFVCSVQDDQVILAGADQTQTVSLSAAVDAAQEAR